MTNLESPTPSNAQNQILMVKPRPGKTEPKHIEVQVVTKWASAKNDELDDPLDDSLLPFYGETEEGAYNLNVKYVADPFPYIPLSYC
ncbi:MAG: hypothetical protein ACIWVG_17980 [Gloeotrichia echinulata HAB0833]